MSAIERNVNQAMRAVNATVQRGQKIPRLLLDQLAHQLHQIKQENHKARSLMVHRAQQQRRMLIRSLKG